MNKAIQLQNSASGAMSKPKKQKSIVWQRIKRNKEIYLLILPVIIYYILFHYKPMYGVVIAFQDFRPRKGISGSEWVGLENFMTFFKSIYFGRLIRNTLRISLSTLIFGFPAPIILALMINELRSKYFARFVQTITYMPHFISLVVICAMIRDFVKSNGVITQLLVALFGYDGKDLLSKASAFVPIYVISNIWQGVGWGSIVYLAALTAIDPQLYEAAEVDGCSTRWKKIIHITLPCLLPTIIIMFIMRMGQIMSVGYEKIILLYNEGIYETADVISTYVYRMGIVNRQYSFSAAVGLFNSVINFALVILANKISRAVSETSLW
ncbi:carbohydrate ABC transporter membrane protein 1, CUT1 family [Thermoclostridium stercorarium subsp. stercorarium DSM 8532]|jgi:putative aldouronate transport system permease protein|uniref:Carbohydrate ABC transporter membrane protein 1, CUT1 family n=2 Tax=Thermoclostridium stercorarium TaxID=1510 RepID=L7VN72_THES1|nr:ABC transporter permease subunit [Thermoclostridium stercorarium]AGC69655.1 carbohydrate ABC transporter membrane protein 1, CUT1 family [Thermoclostridium stercorarium subsp. stercorarium DSM 8532]AGI40607.1 ABC transporter periplasmic subunit-1 [Thermoclostridium stercorarium subsp. stercorarium DSM 8532]ANX02503.1 sugar ABC transporter permease [Thermoclostridium stercorarium subsp. leptospartum DSM 9219]UZQ85594.1 ABC transporter permease subunit [Thermoclostridium stercorarium]